MPVAERKYVHTVLYKLDRMNSAVLCSVLSLFLQFLRAGYSAPCVIAYTGRVIELPEAKLWRNSRVKCPVADN